MKVKMMGEIAGNYRGNYFEVPKDTVCEVIEVKGNVVHFLWEDEEATVYKHHVEFVEEV